jgi:(2Fe-2S) ferredoxin
MLWIRRDGGGGERGETMDRMDRMGERAADDPPLYFRAHLFVCCNRRPDGHARGSCAARGSERLRDYMKARAKELGLAGLRVNTAMCLDRCEQGPCLVIYPEGIWYKIETTSDVDAVLERHVLAGGRVPGLLLPAATAA